MLRPYSCVSFLLDTDCKEFIYSFLAALSSLDLQSGVYATFLMEFFVSFLV